MTWLAGLRILGDRHFRESSRETYQAMFAAWCTFLGDRHMGVLEAREEDASQFFESKRLVAVSRRRYLQLIDKVYLHLLGLGWDAPHPLRDEFRLERELAIAAPKGLTKEELEALIAALGAATGRKAPRNRALAALMVGAGLRSSEACSLKVADVEADFTLRVDAHTVHPAHATLVLPDGPWRRWLSEWLDQRQEQPPPGDLVCPATSSGKPFTTSGLFRCVAQWFEAAQISPEQGGANVLRNTFAQVALSSGRYSLPQVQAFMGHESSRATERHLPGDSAPSSGDAAALAERRQTAW